jgi:rare lipoprotein A
VIEDRGPYVKGRIVDLNKKAADRLGITKKGIDKVTVERIY